MSCPALFASVFDFQGSVSFGKEQLTYSIIHIISFIVSLYIGELLVFFLVLLLKCMNQYRDKICLEYDVTTGLILVVGD